MTYIFTILLLVSMFYLYVQFTRDYETSLRKRKKDVLLIIVENSKCFFYRNHFYFFLPIFNDDHLILITYSKAEYFQVFRYRKIKFWISSLYVITYKY